LTCGFGFINFEIVENHTNPKSKGYIMIVPRRVLVVTVIFALAAGLLVTTGCTKYASPDDLQKLETAKQAALSAEKELDKVKVEHSQVEKDLAGKQKELQATKAELDKVKAP
jgi:septal ring factor EnvC (AmiA/AmiB activator)